MPSTNISEGQTSVWTINVSEIGSKSHDLEMAIYINDRVVFYLVMLIFFHEIKNKRYSKNFQEVQ